MNQPLPSEKRIKAALAFSGKNCFEASYEKPQSDQLVAKQKTTRFPDLSEPTAVVVELYVMILIKDRQQPGEKPYVSWVVYNNGIF